MINDSDDEADDDDYNETDGGDATGDIHIGA